MAIPLFFGNARCSLLIRRCTDSEANATVKILGDLNARSHVLGNLAAEVADKINHPLGLNAVNLQSAAYEVFHVRS